MRCWNRNWPNQKTNWKRKKKRSEREKDKVTIQGVLIALEVDSKYIGQFDIHSLSIICNRLDNELYGLRSKGEGEPTTFIKSNNK
jgi:hypothetical protein